MKAPSPKCDGRVTPSRPLDDRGDSRSTTTVTAARSAPPYLHDHLHNSGRLYAAVTAPPTSLPHPTRHTCAPNRHSRVGRPLHNLFPPPAEGGDEGGGGPAPPSPIWYPRRQDPLSRSATAPPARGSKSINGLRRRESRSERRGRCVAEHALAALTSELASARYPRRDTRGLARL